MFMGTPAQLGPAMGTQEALSPPRAGGCQSLQPQQAGHQLGAGVILE